MTDKPDLARSAAKTLVDISLAGGTAYATSMGIDPCVTSMGGAALEGLCKFVIASSDNRSDPQDMLGRIRDERTDRMVETIRDVLIEAMGLKPEFRKPIEELADAVQAVEDDRGEQRFRAALFKLFDTVMRVTGTLEDIKSNTAYIPEIRRIVKDNQTRMKRLEAASVKRTRPTSGRSDP